MSKTIDPDRAGGAQNAGEARLRRILDTVVALVGTLTPQGVLTEANETALAVADLQRAEVIGKPFWDTYWWSHSPDVQQRLREAVAKAASGETVRYDEEVRVAGGALITIDFQLAPNFDSDGRVVELIPSGIDITERKRAEEAVRRSQETFAKLVKDAPFGVYIVDAEFRLAEISAGSQKVFSGVRPLYGRDFAEVLRLLWPEPFASDAIDRFRHTLATGEPYRSSDTKEQRADTGELEAYDWQIARVTLPDGQYGVVCYFYDLTGQMLAERAVRDSEARFSQILNNVNTYIGLLDPDGTMTEANSAALRAVGASREEVLGASFAEAPWWSFSAEAQQTMREIVARCLAGETVRRDLQYWHADGQVRWSDFQIAPVFGEAGEVVSMVPSGVDITERKQIVQALAESAAAYRLALSAARSGAWEWKIPEDEMDWSPEVSELLAIPHERLPRTMDEFVALLPEEDRDRIRQAVTDHLDSDAEDYEIECRVTRGDDRLMWVRGSGEIVRAADGTPLSTHGLISDIDELRRAQELARERDARIENLLQSTAEGIYGIDPAGDCTFANPACAAMLGFDTPQELIGINMHALVHHHHADGRPYPRSDCKIYHSFLAGERVHVDDEIFWRKDGSYFDVEYWAHPIEEKGKVVGSVVTFLDITARKKSQQELQIAAQRLALALEVGEMGVWDWNMITGEVEWSDSHFILAGYRVGEIKPSYETWLARVHPDDAARVVASLDKAREETSVYEEAFRFLHPDGRIVHVIARGRFFYSEAGEAVRMVGVLDDITKLKAAEDYRQMLMGELNHRVKNTLATIQAMASHTLRTASSPQAFRDTFNGRLRAIAFAHDLLFDNAETGARIADLVHRQVGPYADVESDQLRLDGPDIILDPALAHGLGLVLHELATNASKYGALSKPGGFVEIAWTRTKAGNGAELRLTWRERNGPAVAEPDKTGFGSRLIEQTVAHTLAGDVELNYASKGLLVELRVPMEHTPEGAGQ